MIEIRKYNDADFSDVQFVCLNSEGEPPEKEMCEFVLHIFCDYYLENEGENCFVLSHDGKSVGYVICAENYDDFEVLYENKYIPQIMHMSEGLVNWANEAYEFQKKFKDEYPAHLHIDILPKYQRCGWGSKLINILVEHLKEKGVKGVMLSTGVDNKNACSFYKKYGFKELGVYNKEVAFGIKM